MRRVFCIAGVLCLMAGWVWLKPQSPVAHAASPATQPTAPIISIHGNPGQLGAQHGNQAGQQIRELQSAYFARLFQNPRAAQLALSSAKKFEPFIAPEHLDEIRALSDASRLDLDRTLLTQCFLDLLPMVACSTLALDADAFSDGVARMARNLDFPSMGVADRATALLVFKPEGRNKFVSIGWPGMVGVLTGMNEHGLTLANMEVTRLPRPAEAMPYTLLYRSVLEHCRTVDEAIAYLESATKQTANNLMLMDAQGARAVVELRPGNTTVRRGKPNIPLASTNHQRGPDDLSTGRCWRYEGMVAQAQRRHGRLDRQGVAEIISSVAVAQLTMQCMVFEPSNRLVYLSTGRDAGRGPFVVVDLGTLMQ